MAQTKDGTSYRWGKGPRRNHGPAKPDTSEFPKMVHGKVVNSAEEEAALVAKMGPDKPVPPAPPPPSNKPPAKGGENPLQALLNSAYARIATLEAEIAKRDVIIARLEGERSVAPSPVENVNELADTADEQQQEQEAEQVKDETEPNDSSKVEIPENWKEAHHRTRMSLARQISGQQPTGAEDADATIQAELDRRAKA